MKLNYLAYCIALCFIWSCESETMNKISEAKNQISNATDMVGNLSNISETAENVESRMEELKTMVPITNDEFKNWMPESIKDLQRTQYQFNTAMGANGNLTFSNDNKRLDVSIADGAGETGSAVYATQSFFGGLYGGFESESDSKRESIEERNGVQIMETYYKQDNRSSIRFVVEDRFIINAEGSNMTPEELFEYVQSLDIKNLD